MNIEATGADFRRAMKIVGKVVERRNAVPILDTVRCHANGRLAITGTDLDTFITASVPRKPGKEVSFALMSPKAVTASIADAGGESVSFVYADGKVAIASGALTMKVGTLPCEDWPVDYGNTLTAAFTATLSVDHIRAFDRVSSAISKEETRYYLNGVNLKRLENGLFRVSATDGHRLCLMDIAIPGAAGDIGDIIIPRKVVGILLDLAGKAAGDVKLVVGTAPPANRDDGTAPAKSTVARLGVNFEYGNADVHLTSKMIDGTFPDISRVIPTANDKKMLFDVTELRRALRAVSGKVKRYRAIKLVLGDGTATLSAYYADLDFAPAVTVQCANNAPGFEIGFNGNYLIEMVDAAQAEEIVVTASDTSGPVLVKNPSDTEWTGVLMPMRA